MKVCHRFRFRVYGEGLGPKQATRQKWMNWIFTTPANSKTLHPSLLHLPTALYSILTTPTNRQHSILTTPANNTTLHHYYTSTTPTNSKAHIINTPANNTAFHLYYTCQPSALHPSLLHLPQYIHSILTTPTNNTALNLYYTCHTLKIVKGLISLNLKSSACKRAFSKSQCTLPNFKKKNFKKKL